MAADGVDLVDEDDAGRVLLGLLEQVAHARGADADEHLDEVRAGDGEERHAGLAGDGAGEQRLTGSRRAHHEHAAGNRPAEALVAAGIAQVVDQLADLFLGLVDAGHVAQTHRDLVAFDAPRLALAETEDVAGTAPAEALAPHDVNPHADQQQEREDREEHARQHAGLGRRACVDFHAGLDQIADETRILRRIGSERRAVHALTDDVPVLHAHAGDVAGLHPGEKLRVGDALRARAAAGIHQGRRHHVTEYGHGQND